MLYIVVVLACARLLPPWQAGKAGLKEHQMIHEARALLTKHLGAEMLGVPECLKLTISSQVPEALIRHATN